MTEQGMAEGTLIQDRYRLIRMLGAGGMGEVWEAQHYQLPKIKYAIKFLFSYGQDSEQFERFSREAKILHHLDHINITKIYDVQLQHTPPFITLEYLEGEPLSERLKRARERGENGLPIHEVISIIKQVRDALEVTHQQGVIHRDLKPENIYLCDIEGSHYPLVKVLDFGVSKMSGERQITQHQQGFLGTPQYMSPEQALGNENLDSRADQFSLGIILYEMLSGELPFKGEQIVQIATQIVHGDPSYIRELVPILPEPAAQALHRSLCKSPEDRFSDCATFIDTFIEGAQREQEADEWSLDSHTEVGVRHSLILGSSPVSDELPMADDPQSSEIERVLEENKTLKMSFKPEVFASDEHQLEASQGQTIIDRPMRPPTIQLMETPRTNPELFPNTGAQVWPGANNWTAQAPIQMPGPKKQRSSMLWFIPLALIAVIGGALSAMSGSTSLEDHARQLNESPAIRGALIMPDFSEKIHQISLIDKLSTKHKTQIKQTKKLPQHQRIVGPNKVTFLLSSPKTQTSKTLVEGFELHWFGPHDEHITHRLSPLPIISKDRAFWRTFHTFSRDQVGRWSALLTSSGKVVAELPFEVKK